MREEYTKLLNTAEAAGIPIISDNHCCKLLAWVYAYGGGNEAVVFNVKLNENIKYAQRRLNITGGATPNPALYTELRNRIMEADKAITGKTDNPKWATDICDFYNISVRCLSNKI